MEINLIKKYYISKHSLRKEECFCNLFIVVNSNLFDKNRTQDEVKCHIQHGGSLLRSIVSEQANYK